MRRDFSADGIDQKHFGGFKEAETAEGPVFSAAVLDLCSRRMAGSATSDHYPTAELAEAAVNTAAATRGGDIDGVVFHSDKGSQSLPAARHRPIHRANRHRLKQRSGRVVLPPPSDTNSFDRRCWASKAQARQEIATWVCGWYNHHRLHSTIGMVPPVEHETTNTPNPHNQPLHD